MKKNKWFPWIYIFPFMLLIFTVPLVATLSLDATKSESENRSLQQFPGFKSLLNLKQSKELDAYVADQLPYRDNLVSMYTQYELSFDKKVVRNLYISTSDHLIQVPPPLKKSAIDEAVKETVALEKYVRGNGKQFLMAFTPFKNSGLSESLIGLFHRNYPGHFRYFIDQLSTQNPQIRLVDISTPWHDKDDLATRQSYYFKTDSHWNALGARSAFEILVKDLSYFNGFTHVTFKQDALEYVQITGKSFLGDFSRRLQFLDGIKDQTGYFRLDAVDTDTTAINDKENTIRAWLETDLGLDEIAFDALYASGIDADELDYNKLYTSNYGYFKVVNPRALNANKVLIIKDSYFNAMLPFFVQYFTQIEIVDPRYIKSGDCYSLISSSDADSVLVIYNDSFISGGMYDFKK